MKTTLAPTFRATAQAGYQATTGIPHVLNWDKLSERQRNILIALGISILAAVGVFLLMPPYTGGMMWKIVKGVCGVICALAFALFGPYAAYVHRKHYVREIGNTFRNLLQVEEKLEARENTRLVTRELCQLSNEYGSGLAVAVDYHAPLCDRLILLQPIMMHRLLRLAGHIKVREEVARRQGRQAIGVDELRSHMLALYGAAMRCGMVGIDYRPEAILFRDAIVEDRDWLEFQVEPPTEGRNPHLIPAKLVWG